MGLHTMSEVPSGSWDSPQQENLARSAGRKSRIPGETDSYLPGASVPPEDDDESAGPDPADVHTWYTTGMELLAKGSPAAAAHVLQRAVNAEPGSRSVREALARAQFDTGQYAAAAENFRAIIEASPTEDYAYFGLGLSLSRTGEHAAASRATPTAPPTPVASLAGADIRFTLEFLIMSFSRLARPIHVSSDSP